MSRPHPTPLSSLGDARLDVLVVGAGITGACIALDAAQRGLRVGLVDRGDFGGGATANCLRIVHGGLRYLQHFDVRRSRESILERSIWLRSAPHLVEPLPVVVPTHRRRFPPRWMLGGALAINEALSIDRNDELETDRRIPRSRLLSKEDCRTMVPSLDQADLTGGILFYDAIMYSPERLTLEVVQAAQSAGAVTANYVAFDGIDSVDADGHRVRVRDMLSGQTTDLQTRWIVNAAGANVGDVMRRIAGGKSSSELRFSLAMNFVTNHPASGPAFTVSGGLADSDRVGGAGARQLFVVPWRGQRLIGTAHLPFTGEIASAALKNENVELFLAELRGAWPPLGITARDIRHVQWGLLPDAERADGHRMRLLKQHRLIDHAAEGIAQAITVVSVKFTTARRVAEDVVDHVTGAVRSNASALKTLPLPGRPTPGVDADTGGTQTRPDQRLATSVTTHIARAYGARYSAVVSLSDRIDGGDRCVSAEAPVTFGQLVYSARNEMVHTVDDLLWRRTELGARGLVTPAVRDEAQRALDLATTL